MDINNLQPKKRTQVIEDRSQTGYNNWSDIATKLIKLAAKHCNMYASDLFYDLQSIYEYKKAPDQDNKRFVLGFRQCGVDSVSFVSCRTASEYRALWVLDITTDNSYTEMRLWEANLNG